MLDGVDLDVMPGTSMVVIGGSGTGKSVLLKSILGLVEPDEGSIEIDGRDVLRMRRREREAVNRGIGMLFQAAALFDSLPVWENVAFGLLAQRKLGRGGARTRAGEVLTQVGLAPSVGELSPAELSGGMQKRVGLARAIAAQPEHPVLRRADHGAGPDHGRGDRRADRGLRQAARLDRDGDHPRHGLRHPHRRPGGDAVPRTHRVGRPAAELLESGNAVVDQFTHGRREGPIQMELRK